MQQFKLFTLQVNTFSEVLYIMVCAYAKFVDAMIDNFYAIMKQKVLCGTKNCDGKTRAVGIAQLNIMADT